MAEPLRDKIKYGLLKAIDISGFKVFDPPVRLAFGEEPRKQLGDIARYMLLPIIFVLCCLGIWTVAGPNHKTKSGEVPTPARVLTAWNDNQRFDERQKEKQNDFILGEAERRSTLAKVEQRLVELETEAAELAAEADRIQAEAQEAVAIKTAPLEASLAGLKATHESAESARESAETQLAEKVAAKEAEATALVTLIRDHEALEDQEKDAEKAIETRIKEILADPPVEVSDSRMAANRVADEVQHFKKRVDILTKENRNVKRASYLEKVEADQAELVAATEAPKIIREAKSIARNQERAEDSESQTYPRTATIFWQTKRSLATVFVGFLLAAALAVPIGIMCGLNRIVMACLTPIISIFRPVSPVVWLLIFQIIVGAFFPDPETHPLFVTLNNESWFGWITNPLAFLQTNPAMIFSACTVAMCALWPALVNTALGVSSIDKDHMNVARVLRLGFWSRLFKIIIPSSLPLVFAGLRISLGVGWMVLIAAEALSSSDGLGKFVWDEYQNGSSQSFANIILACFVVGIIGFFLDRIMIFLQRLVSFDDGSATA